MRSQVARNLLIACLGLALAVTASSARAQINGCTPNFSGAIVYLMQTPLGAIPVELYPNMAPMTVANFRSYADGGDWNGSLIHRSVPGFVIQGGGFRDNGSGYASIPTDPPVTNEPCLSNTAGTIAMARIGGQPNSATNQWFINLVDNPTLDSVDGGFTAFGRVIGNGMSVAQAIAVLPRFDTLAYLQLPFNQIFREFPLSVLPTDPPGGYGCSRATPVFGLEDQSAPGLFTIDPTRNGSAVVPILLDPQCTGAGATGPSDVPCTPAVGRRVYEINLVNQTVVTGIPIAMSCNAVSESEDSWAFRRTGTIAKLRQNDIVVSTVPEPSRFGQLAAGIAALAVLALRRRS